MRILIDTNILFSTILFPNSKPARAVIHIARNHQPILCEQSIEELEEIVKRKAPKYLSNAESFLSHFSYELIPAVKGDNSFIRDATDQPILNAAILYKVDIILTGDKDFLSLNLKRPRCMSVSQFIEEEGT